MPLMHENDIKLLSHAVASSTYAAGKVENTALSTWMGETKTVYIEGGQAVIASAVNNGLRVGMGGSAGPIGSAVLRWNKIHPHQALLVYDELPSEKFTGMSFTCFVCDPPLPAILHCLKCGERHVDLDEWKAYPHHKHLCAACGFSWRVVPFAYGVADE